MSKSNKVTIVLEDIQQGSTKGVQADLQFDHPPGPPPGWSNAERFAIELMEHIKAQQSDGYMLESINSESGESTILDSAGVFRPVKGGQA